MDGRWTIFKWGAFARVTAGPDTEGVPVVPCDDAAIERAAIEMARQMGYGWDALTRLKLAPTQQSFLRDAEAVLRAAGATS